MDISKRIRELREARGYTQAEMARSLGIALTNYGKIERGGTDLSVSRITEISKILDVSPVDLFTEYDAPTASLVGKLQDDLKNLNEGYTRALGQNNKFFDQFLTLFETFDDWLYSTCQLRATDLRLSINDRDFELSPYIEAINHPNIRKVYFGLLSMGALWGVPQIGGQENLVWKLAPYSKEEKNLLADYMNSQFEQKRGRM